MSSRIGRQGSVAGGDESADNEAREGGETGVCGVDGEASLNRMAPATTVSRVPLPPRSFDVQARINRQTHAREAFDSISISSRLERATGALGYAQFTEPLDHCYRRVRVKEATQQDHDLIV